MYQNEIKEMDREELAQIIEEYSLKIEDTEFIDCDEVIELLEQEQGKLFKCPEDDILDTILNGNWTDASKQMHEMYITPHGLVDYINDYRFEEYEEAYDWFTLESAVSITELYNQKEVA